ncbi:hypothetical protein ACJX0J_016903, partial [Zea mays]
CPITSDYISTLQEQYNIYYDHALSDGALFFIEIHTMNIFGKHQGVYQTLMIVQFMPICHKECCRLLGMYISPMPHFLFGTSLHDCHTLLICKGNSHMI